MDVISKIVISPLYVPVCLLLPSSNKTFADIVPFFTKSLYHLFFIYVLLCYNNLLFFKDAFMNILVLNYEYPPLGGGAAPVCRDISKRYVEMGHKVTIVTMGFKNLPSYEFIDGMDIYRVKCWRSKKSSCMPWEQFTYNIAAKRFIKKHKELQNVDVCHTHFVIPTGVVSSWYYKKYKVPVIITAHGSDVEGYNSKKYVQIMHKLLRPSWRKIVDNTYALVSPSDFLEKLILTAYNVPEKVIKIPNGIDIDHYQSLYKDNCQKEKTILLMGRMQKHKNMQTALLALSKVDLGDWKIKILGDGPYRQELEAIVTNNSLSESVEFCGWVENNSPAQLDYLAKASIYITASEFENCPMAVLETIAAGCFPLLSDIPAHRQMVPNDEFYFNADDVDALTKKIQARINAGPGVFEYSLEHYKWDNVMVKYESLLKKAAT